MAEFKPLRGKNVISSSHVVNNIEVEAVIVFDESIVTEADKLIQIDRIMRNDDIVIDLFEYVRQLEAGQSNQISREQVINQLRNVIISDYPIQVRDI